MQPLTETPEPPEWLRQPSALAEWARVARILVANRLLCDADTTALAHYCALHGALVEAWRRGEAPTGHLLTRFNTLAVAFGITMASRSKLRPLSPAPAENLFARFRLD